MPACLWTIHRTGSDRISANFPTGRNLKELSFLKSFGQISDNFQQIIPFVPNAYSILLKELLHLLMMFRM